MYSRPHLMIPFGILVTLIALVIGCLTGAIDPAQMRNPATFDALREKDEAGTAVARARDALARGDADRAFALTQSAVDGDGTNRDARKLLAALLLRRADWAGASAQCLALLQTDPRDNDARLALAQALHGQGRDAEARALCQSVQTGAWSTPDERRAVRLLQKSFPVVPTVPVIPL